MNKVWREPSLQYSIRKSLAYGMLDWLCLGCEVELEEDCLGCGDISHS